MKESVLQKKCRDYAETHGFFSLKNEKTSGIPDCFFFKDSRCFFVEFKSQNGKCSEIQKQQIHLIEQKKTKVFIVRTFKEFEEIIKKWN